MIFVLVNEPLIHTYIGYITDYIAIILVSNQLVLKILQTQVIMNK